MYYWYPVFLYVYKDTKRGAPKIVNDKMGEFTLRGKDEKLVADLANEVVGKK